MCVVQVQTRFSDLMNVRLSVPAAVSLSGCFQKEWKEHRRWPCVEQSCVAANETRPELERGPLTRCRYAGVSPESC